MSGALSPASSPRLPSPPPIAEDQIGSSSPGPALFDDQNKLSGGVLDTGASRRIRPGTRADEMAEGPPLVELNELDSAFQLTEHVKALHYAYTHPSALNSTVPVGADFARQLSRPPPNTSKEIWLYELGRFLIQKTNAIIVALFADSPPCSPQTCPEMRASEWQYLCAVHDPPKSCSAIDYCCHTLDWAATTLTSSKMFPSRLGLGSGQLGGGNDKVLQQQMKEITNIFRRVYRIYAHAWFQHRDMFWRVEGKSGLYVLFKTVCDEYGMIQPENYTIPPEAEGLEPELTPQEAPHSLSLLQRDPDNAEGRTALPEPSSNVVPQRSETTKRHKAKGSSVQSSLSPSIQEELEEDEDDHQGSKPGLDRLTTALKEGDDSTLDSSTLHTSEVEPVLGIDRSETVKPPTIDDNGSDNAEHEVGDATILADAPSELKPPSDTKIEQPEELPKPEVSEVTGSAEDASKGAAD